MNHSVLILGLQEEPIPFNTSVEVFPRLGKLAHVGLFSATMITKRLTIKGWPSGHAADSEDTCRFAAAQGIKTMCQTFTLDQANEAYENMMAGKPRFRNCTLSISMSIAKN